jgi:hypothetical protein
MPKLSPALNIEGARLGFCWARAPVSIADDDLITRAEPRNDWLAIVAFERLRGGRGREGVEINPNSILKSAPSHSRNIDRETRAVARDVGNIGMNAMISASNDCKREL